MIILPLMAVATLSDRINTEITPSQKLLSRQCCHKGDITEVKLLIFTSVICQKQTMS